MLEETNYSFKGNYKNIFDIFIRAEAIISVVLDQIDRFKARKIEVRTNIYF